MAGDSHTTTRRKEPLLKHVSLIAHSFGLPVTAQQEVRPTAAVKTLRCTAHKPRRRRRQQSHSDTLSFPAALPCPSNCPQSCRHQSLRTHPEEGTNVPPATNRKSRKNVLIRSSTTHYFKATNFSPGKNVMRSKLEETRTCFSISPSLLSIVCLPRLLDCNAHPILRKESFKKLHAYYQTAMVSACVHQHFRGQPEQFIKHYAEQNIRIQNCSDGTSLCTMLP